MVANGIVLSLIHYHVRKIHCNLKIVQYNVKVCHYIFNKLFILVDENSRPISPDVFVGKTVNFATKIVWHPKDEL